MAEKVENVVIIGGGPAGLAAAVYNSRANLQPVLFAGSPPGGQLMITTEVENYPGLEGVQGPEIIEKIRAQAVKFGTQIFDENVTAVDFAKKPYTVSSSARSVYAKTVIIATGAKALWLGLESEKRLQGRGVSACATCDGFFFRNKVVAVVGGGDTAMEEALTLTKFASKIYVIHRRDSFRASKIMQQRVLTHPKIEVIWNTQVTEILGEQKVEGVRLNRLNQPEPVKSADSTSLTDLTDSTLQVDGVFIAIGHKPDTALFADKVDLDSAGYIVTSTIQALNRLNQPEPVKSADSTSLTDSHRFNFAYPSMTSVDGVFAAGDCVDHRYRQAATASGMGVAAALETERYLELNQPL